MEFKTCSCSVVARASASIQLMFLFITSDVAVPPDQFLLQNFTRTKFMLRTAGLRIFCNFAQVNRSTRSYASTATLSQYDGSFPASNACLLTLKLAISQSVSLAEDMRVAKLQQALHEREQKPCC
jgi:hypothetical protein